VTLLHHFGGFYEGGGSLPQLQLHFAGGTCSNSATAADLGLLGMIAPALAKSAKGRAPDCSLRRHFLGLLDKREQVGIDLVRIRRGHSVRKTWIHL
jgi:hypothetical protein